MQTVPRTNSLEVETCRDPTQSYPSAHYPLRLRHHGLRTRRTAAASAAARVELRWHRGHRHADRLVVAGGRGPRHHRLHQPRRVGGLPGTPRHLHPRRLPRRIHPHIHIAQVAFVLLSRVPTLAATCVDTARTGYAHQAPACCAYQRHRAPCPRGAPRTPCQPRAWHHRSRPQWSPSTSSRTER